MLGPVTFGGCKHLRGNSPDRLVQRTHLRRWRAQSLRRHVTRRRAAFVADDR
jgi:hypothetical protein